MRKEDNHSTIEPAPLGIESLITWCASCNITLVSAYGDVYLRVRTRIEEVEERSNDPVSIVG
jgi:hypothetical protein